MNVGKRSLRKCGAELLSNKGTKDEDLDQRFKFHSTRTKHATSYEVNSQFFLFRHRVEYRLYCQQFKYKEGFPLVNFVKTNSSRIRIGGRVTQSVRIHERSLA